MHFAIVSYTFPPAKEIGGRRWAKFSYQLVQKGHKVTVICSKNAVKLDWYEKEFPGIAFSLLPKHYPDWLTGNTKSIREKILYWVFTQVLSHFTKINLFDRGFAWRKPMLHALEELHVKVPIDVLVVTGAPFSLLAYGAEFKLRHGEILYVADLRDPWTWGGYYGIPDMSLSKRKFQEKMEHKTIEACDIVCYPTNNMGDFLASKYPDFTSKLYLLPHAYDPEKFKNIKRKEKRQGFIYGGALYPGIEDYLRNFSKVLKTHPDSGFSWDIFTGSSYPLIDAIFTKESVRKFPLIPEDQLFQHIANSAAYLAFYPGTDKDLISTKFFEIIYTETPILYIGEEGEVGKFIRENRLGVHILPENLESELPQYLSGNVPFVPGYFDVVQYSFSIVTSNFLEKLSGPNN